MAGELSKRAFFRVVRICLLFFLVKDMVVMTFSLRMSLKDA